MTRLFLHQSLPQQFIEDTEGLEFSSLEDARKEAIESAREMICDMARGGHIELDCKFQIANEGGKVLLVVPFSDALTLNLPAAETVVS